MLITLNIMPPSQQRHDAAPFIDARFYQHVEFLDDAGHAARAMPFGTRLRQDFLFDVADVVTVIISHLSASSPTIVIRGCRR